MRNAQYDRGMERIDRRTAAHSSLSAQARSARASKAATARWARCEDRTAATAAATEGTFRRFLDQVPDGLPEDVRHARAQQMLRAHLAWIKHT